MGSFFKENRSEILALTIAVVFLYIFGVNGPLFWDDLDWIVNNPFVHTLTWGNLVDIFTQNILAGVNGISNYYRPLLLVTFIPNYLLSGTNPVLYHIVNDVIHLGNGILIYSLLLRWLGNKRVAFIAALLFLIHPLQTEAVSYVVGRADPLSVFFTLGGILVYVRGRPWLAGGAAVLAILTRETGVLFPAYLAIAIIAFELEGTFWQRCKSAAIKILPYLGISAAYALLRLTVLNFQDTLNFTNQSNLLTEHVLYRFYTFFDALVLYVRLIIVPTGLHFFDDVPVSVTFTEGLVWLGALLIIACLAWLWWLYRKKEWAGFTIWFFGLGIFFTNLSLSSGIIATINARSLEHWLYFSLFGACTIAAWYLDRLWSYLETRRLILKQACVAVFALYCLFLGSQTIERNLIWASPVALFKNILIYDPTNYQALNNLGNWYYSERDSAHAKLLWTQSAASAPSDPTAFTNLGYLANDEGRIAESEAYYKLAISISPYYFNAYRNLSALYTQQKKYDSALEVVRQLQEKYPSQDYSAIITGIKSLQSATTTEETRPQ